ncbi:type II CAAX endopeptidase family protein [Metabacillus indicus]|uniref:CPBP family intramembrane glutamic endopeptidase n=1 Tax=Metabacillus indicus TaxID=246786 RepID=UPI002A061B60|nr:type II CAAX endopeptidase family protein [Metabacillus indicus]MDX8292138.1 type II CAAX endopeptidase family protein [Metabacillus indicus]
MKKEYWLIILTYIVMQFSGILGIPLLLKLGVGEGESMRMAQIMASGYWTVFSFAAAFVLVLFFMRTHFRDNKELRGDAAPVSVSILWAVAGVFLALTVQVLAASIETRVLGIQGESENTQIIMEVLKVTPLLILVTSIIGPILEEIIFRKILFGALYQRMNFFLSALISSIVFALVHGEPQHLLLYGSMGFVFAFLYIQTKRLLVPIFAHVAMNTLVVLLQSNREQLEEMMKKAEQMQFIFGGM